MQAYIHYINEIVHTLILTTEINAISHVIAALKAAIYLLQKHISQIFIVVLLLLQATALC